MSAAGVLVYGGKRGLAQLRWIGRDGKPLGALGRLAIAISSGSLPTRREWRPLTLSPTGI